MSPSASAALFSALLTSASPTNGDNLYNSVWLCTDRVRGDIERFITPSVRSVDMERLCEDFSKNLSELWLVSLMEDVLGTFNSSRQELLTMVAPIAEKNIHEMQQQIQENNGFFQISHEHWQELMGIANDETRDWKERLIAIIRLISIVNFFTLLVGVYSITILNAHKGKRAPSILFWWFTISNGLGATGLFLGWTPLEWSGYAIATVAAATTFFLLRKNEKKEKSNLLDGDFIEHMRQHTAFSVYDIKGKALAFSPKLLSILWTTWEEVSRYQEEKGEIVTLFYPDIEERERIAAYLSELKESGQPYEATFFPRRVDTGKKIALHFNTVPRKNKKGEVIGNNRFAEDVTKHHRDDVDHLTGELDKIGFEKSFYNIVLSNKQREVDCYKDKILLSFAYLDLDGFKRANDIYSHRNADVVLKEFTKMARIHFRSEDIIARLGGDEFWFICDTCNKETVLKKMNTLRDELSRTTFEVISGVLVEGGRKIHATREAALEYEKTRNLEIQQSMEEKGRIYDPHIQGCIGGIGISGGITDFEYGRARLEEENALRVFATLEQQCERVMTWAKKLSVLGVGAQTAKNAIGIAFLDQTWQVVGAHIYNGEREEAFEIDRRKLENETGRLVEAVELAVENR